MDRWGNIKVNEQELFQRTVDQTKYLILELNKKQLLSGIDAKGVSLPPYSPSWQKVRAKRGLQTSRKDLKFTGRFHEEMYVFFNEDIMIYSEDWKAAILESKWGEIFGLTQENLDIFLNIFTNVFQDQFIMMIRES